MKRKLQVAIILCSIAVWGCGCDSNRNPEGSVEETMTEELQSEEDENEPNGAATTGNRDEILQLAVNSDGCIEVEGDYTRLSASLQDYNEWIVQKAEELTEQYGEKTYGSVSVQRADSYALGLLVKFRTEESGDVIWQALETRNYNTETGEFVALADAFTDRNKISESIEAQLLEEYSSEELPDDIEGQVKNWLADETKVDWTIGYQGITFYVPLAFEDREETISVMLLFSKYPDLFMDEVISVPDVYAFDMDSTGTFFYDVDDDKDAEKIQLSFSCFVTDDIYEIDRVNLSVDDSSYVGSIDTGVYNTFSKGYLIHMEDRDYICVYAHTMYDNLGGYVVFDLKTGEVCGDEALFFYLDNDRITNPNAIFVKVKMDPVTWGVTVMEGIWKVNTDGVLCEREDTEYTYNGIVCENTEELEVLVMETSEEENADDTIVMEKGTRFELIKTDGHTWCDIRLQDGSMRRISFEHYVDVEKWMDMREELLPIRFVGENIEEEILQTEFHGSKDVEPEQESKHYDSEVESELTEKDFEIKYKDFIINGQTTADEIKSTLGIPEYFEDNNKGYIATVGSEYRWQLRYPEYTDSCDIRIIFYTNLDTDETTIKTVAPENIATNRGVKVGDNVDKIYENYGLPVEEKRYDANAEYLELNYTKENQRISFVIDENSRLIKYIYIDYNLTQEEL